MRIRNILIGLGLLASLAGCVAYPAPGYAPPPPPGYGYVEPGYVAPPGYYVAPPVGLQFDFGRGRGWR